MPLIPFLDSEPPEPLSAIEPLPLWRSPATRSLETHDLPDDDCPAVLSLDEPFVFGPPEDADEPVEIDEELALLARVDEFVAPRDIATGAHLDQERAATADALERLDTTRKACDAELAEIEKTRSNLATVRHDLAQLREELVAYRERLVEERSTLIVQAAKLVAFRRRIETADNRPANA